MKLSECNVRQKKAYINIYNAANWIIGGYENTLSDFGEESEEYQNAKAHLANHDGLVEELYEAATTDLYEEGDVVWGKGVEKYLKDIRFCGKEWLLERCEARIKKMGY